MSTSETTTQSSLAMSAASATSASSNFQASNSVETTEPVVMTSEGHEGTTSLSLVF
ncbi:MAG TPA: hypothetical protein VLA56_15235 [Pseudomonadales bacterium]|nr:hypothetical protein [Pseudomonadales bacterium]